MSIWFFELPDGSTGGVRAADDDAAWESVIALREQAPNLVQWVRYVFNEVAA